MRTFSSVSDLQRVRGERIGESAWFTVTQQLVDDFARITNDRQWIHVDPERARRESPLGTTIAHGFLTLSLLSSMIEECIAFPTARMAFNYGFERVRFVAPVAVGAQIRGTFVLDDVRDIDSGADMTWRVEVEIRDTPKPALAALWLTRVVFAPEAGAAPR
ncbi:MAG TPA: MaoC family dehydratase [Candidatus Limnocylindrales bacterium]|nr:MaoC family dehydratase [Candidatus Limnocylindrales bacterium]